MFLSSVSVLLQDGCNSLASFCSSQERVLQEKVHELLGQITAIDTDAALVHGLVTNLIPERRRIQDHRWLGKVIPLTVTAHETVIRLEQFHDNCREVKEELRNVETELIYALSAWELIETVRKQVSDVSFITFKSCI